MMNTRIDTYPFDIIFFIFISFILLPIILLDVNSTFKTLFGIPFLFFIPGYLLLYAIFPEKKVEKGITTIERIALSIGLSIILVSFLGLILNYTPWGIQIESILITLNVSILILGSLGWYRWINTESKKRFIPTLDFLYASDRSSFQRTITFLLVILVVITSIVVVYVIISVQPGETFTSFYLLDPLGNTTRYPQNLSVDENATVIIGLVNHEQQKMNYTIEVWLVNQTVYYNESTGQNETRYTNMWFMDKETITLDSLSFRAEPPELPQWEFFYRFSINRSGEYKLLFLLFTIPTASYDSDRDYIQAYDEKLDASYRNTHLILQVSS